MKLYDVRSLSGVIGAGSAISFMFTFAIWRMGFSGGRATLGANTPTVALICALVLGIALGVLSVIVFRRAMRED